MIAVAANVTPEERRQFGYDRFHINPQNNWLYDRSDNWCSVVYWYRKVDNKPMTPPLPGRADRSRGIAKQPWE